MLNQGLRLYAHPRYLLQYVIASALPNALRMDYVLAPAVYKPRGKDWLADTRVRSTTHPSFSEIR